MASIGTIENYDEKNGNMELYLKRMNGYFIVNKIEENMKAAVFLTLIGPKLYQQIFTMLSPTNTSPENMSYKKLTKLLLQNFNSKKYVLMERYKLNKRNQHKTETIVQYVETLKEMANGCEYGQFYDEALRDRLISGIHSDVIRNALLREEDLTFSNALKIGITFELSESIKKKENKKKNRNDNTDDIKSNIENLNTTKENDIKKVSKCGEIDGKKEFKCFKCGGVGHSLKYCPSNRNVQPIRQPLISSGYRHSMPILKASNTEDEIWKQTSIYAGLPTGAVFGGVTDNNASIYIGRALHNDVLSLVKIIPSENKACTSYDDIDIPKYHYEVLVGNHFSWQPSDNGRVPWNAIPLSGETKTPTYIGRARFGKSLTVGVIVTGNEFLLITVNGKQQKMQQYEVLTKQNNSSNGKTMETYSWKNHTPNLPIPKDAVVGGKDSDNTIIYVGRATHNGDQIPAKVIPQKKVAYVSFNGQEIPKYNYEILTGAGFTWVGSSSGAVPNNALVAGRQSNGEPLYVGRAHIKGSLSIGKVHQSHRCIYVPYDGLEHSLPTYEVLVEPKLTLTWIPSSVKEMLPQGAVLAGKDADGSPIYVGRSTHNSDVIPGKVIPNKKIAYVPHDGKEHSKQNYEVLCNGNVKWIRSSNGAIPPRAIPGGRTSTGEQLYIGRAPYKGSLTPGKVHPSHGSLYIGFLNIEIPFKDYEILVEY